ncbi:MAG: potassium channel family protein [Pseudomonadota bacterium]
MVNTQHWIVIAVTVVTVVVCVIAHYEALRLISRSLPKPHHQERRGVVYLILGLLLVHAAEIWLFGLVNYALVQREGFGQLVGMASVNLFDCIYYSAMVYTTVGFGDIVPEGPIRFSAGMEGITGLTMIAWSASFTFLTMSGNWTSDDNGNDAE